MRYEVRAPLAGFTGNVVGIDFENGIGEVDTASDAGQAAFQFFQRHAYAMTPLDEPEPEQAPDDEFDPGAHTVDEVLSHIAAAGTDEAVRVLDAEAAGKARAGILSKREQLLADKEGEGA